MAQKLNFQEWLWLIEKYWILSCDSMYVSTRNKATPVIVSNRNITSQMYTPSWFLPPLLLVHKPSSLGGSRIHGTSYLRPYSRYVFSRWSQKWLRVISDLQHLGKDVFCAQETYLIASDKDILLRKFCLFSAYLDNYLGSVS